MSLYVALALALRGAGEGFASKSNALANLSMRAASAERLACTHSTSKQLADVLPQHAELLVRTLSYPLLPSQQAKAVSRSSTTCFTKTRADCWA